MNPAFTLSKGSYTIFKFPTGEIQVTLSPKFLNKNYVFEAFPVTITGSILSSDNLIELLQLNNALNSAGVNSNLIRLVMPYCAYSRQDRICNPGESFSLKVFAQLINSCNFASVTTWDNHSDVSTALINNCTNIHVKDLIEPVSNNEYDYLVSPDAGANKKVFALSQATKIPMIRADKIRDTATGAIIDTQAYTTKEQIEGKRLLIVDDICAGGRTFKELAQKLKSIANCNIDLYVTHGFFNNSIDVINSILASGISYIHTSNNPYKLKHQRLENV